MRKPHRDTVNLLHLNVSPDRAHNSSDNQKIYKDDGMNLHGTLKNNQGDFCKKETLISERAGQKNFPEKGHQCPCYAEHEVNIKKLIIL